MRLASARVTRDITYAIRSFGREPLFVGTMLLTFALAIGANAAMFGLVARLMLAAPPGLRAAEELARVQLRITEADGDSYVQSTTSYPVFRTLERTTGVFAGVAAMRSDTLLVGRSPDAVPLSIIGASGGYFATLGPRAALGRFFGPADDEGPFGNSVIVLGYAYWRRAFDGDRAVIGRELLIDDQAFTIIGVAPSGFNGDGLAAVDAFMPLSASFRKQGGEWQTNRGLYIVSIITRLRNGVLPVAARQMATAALHDETSIGGRSRSPSVELEPVIPGVGARQTSQSRIALWLSGVSLIVLLIATANVGTLLSLRAGRRRREIAVRIAMGASHGDLARQLLIESMLLSATGAAIGLLLSHWFANVIRVTLLPSLAATETFVDGRVLAASVGAACLAGLAAGLAPLVQSRRVSLVADLRAGGGQGTSGRLAYQNTLVSIQVALCTVLVAGAALFVESLARVEAQDLGFTTEHLLYVTLDFRGSVAGAQRDLTYTEAVRRLRTTAGVSGATVAAGIPFGPHNIPPVSVPGLPWPPTNYQLPIMYGATPDYLRLMGVTLVAGRLIADADRRGGQLVVLVNESMARTAWPGQSALGKCVRAGFVGFVGGEAPSPETNPAAAAPCREVIGIVRDSRARSLRPEQNEDRLMQYYVPFDQLPDTPMPDPAHVMGLIVRTREPADRAAGVVQRAIQTSTALRVFARVRPYQDLIDPQLRAWRLGATLFSVFSILALAIAAVGLFGVVSYVVSQRTAEIGVRLALGGTRARVASLVVRDALRMSTIGVAAGVVGGLAAAPVVASMLFQTSPRDPASFAIAGVVLLAATVIAAARPAWRAGSVNPVVALRAD